MTTSNTFDCFSEFVGQKVVGVLFNALPRSRRDIASGTKALIFEDGRALVIAFNGSYWVENEREVRSAINLRKRALEAGNREIEQVLEAAGALDS